VELKPPSWMVTTVLASEEKPRLEGNSGRIDTAHWREMIRDLSFGNP